MGTATPLDKHQQEIHVNKSVMVMLISTLLMAGTLTCRAQENTNEQIQSGEAGYKFGCSLANSRGIQACGEMPSYRAMELERQRREAAQAQAEREYHNSLLHRGARSPTPAVPND